MSREEKDIMCEILDIIDDIRMELTNIKSKMVISERLERVYEKIEILNESEEE